MAKLVYIVNAENIGKITAVYLHHHNKDQKGTIVLDLLHSPREPKKGVIKAVEKTPEGKTKGTLSIGGATSDDLQGLLKGKTLADLYKLMVNGSIYVTVHTKDYPDGEIRGNSFVPIDDLFPNDTNIQWNNK